MMGTLWFTPLVAAAVLGAADDPLAAPAAALVLRRRPPRPAGPARDGGRGMRQRRRARRRSRPRRPARQARGLGPAPLEEAPDAIVVPDEGTMVCLDRSPRGALVSMTSRARSARAALGDLSRRPRLRSCGS